jgi:hypothetical protein
MLRYYVDGRLFEWVITLSMLWLAGEMFVSPQLLHSSAFQWVLQVMTPAFINLFLFLIGWTRLIGLLLNGHQIRGRRLGPIIRSVTAVSCAVMWVQFDLALIETSVRQGFLSVGVPFWSMFTIGELYVAYRAVAGNGRTD